MFSGFQPNMAQNNAFQIVLSLGQLNGWMGGPMDKWSYANPWDKLREEKYQQVKIEAARAELKAVDDALKAKEQQQTEALKAAELQDQLQAELMMQQLMNEISKLRYERALLIQRINEGEALLILMMAAKRRRLRAV